MDALTTLTKASGKEPPKAYFRRVNALMDAGESAALKAVQKALKGFRARFVRRFKVDRMVELCGALQKANQDDENVTAEIRKIIEASLSVEFVDDLTDALTPMVDALAKEFTTVADVSLNWHLVNEKAVQYLRDHATNYFSTFTDDQAVGIHAAIADALASDERYTLKDVISNIAKTYGKDVLYFETSQGVRSMDVTTWATTTARTETARAASFAQKAALASLSLQAWQWFAQGSCCDACDDNDGEIVAVGDAFPSGATEPPEHPNCRCFCTMVMDELLSLDDPQDDAA